MNSKTVAVGLGSFGLGALVAWAITADRLDGKMRRNQLILGEMLSRKEAEIVALTERVLHPTPWTPASDEEVAEAAATTDQIISDEDRAAADAIRRQARGPLIATNPLEGVEFDSIVDPNRAVVETDDGPDDLTPEEEAEVAEAVSDHQRSIASIVAKYASDPEEIHEFTEIVRRDADGARETPPFHISVAQYASDPDEGDDYEKITMSWYPRTRVLLDDDDEIVPDVNNVVGYKNLDRFGDESNDPNVVFVRNRHLETDFEVVNHEDEDLPIHLQYQMTREEYNTNVAAGHLPKFRDEDSD
jgi:hypothetical protein